MKSKYLLLIFLFFPFTMVFSQSTAWENYVEKHPNGTPFYFYQSVLRVLHSEGKQQDSDYNKLIKDLDYVRFFYQSDSTDMKKQVKDFLHAIREEGYEDLMELRESGFRIRLYMKGEGEKGAFMGLVAESDYMLIFEMGGSPNLKYIGSLSDLNLNKIKDIIPSDVKFNIN